MKTKIILIISFLFLTSLAKSQNISTITIKTTNSDKKNETNKNKNINKIIDIKRIKNENEKKDFLKEQSTDYITTIITSTQTEKKDILNKLADSLVFDIKGSPLLLLPVADSSKDLGLNWGIMPILAIKNKKKDEISSVLAPSINKNKYLGYTYTYRHYIFPTEKSLLVTRASISDNAQQELFFHYYEPQLLHKNIRLNLEFRNWHNPKSSFYGYGPDTKEKNRASYIYYLNGGELSLTLPIYKDFIFFDYTPSYYENKIRDGIVGDNKLSQLYPYEYSLYGKEKKFFTNKFSFLLDTTNHPFLPQIGSYIIFSALFSRKNIKSDYDYSIYTIEIKDYYNYRLLNKSVTALRFMLQWQTGGKIPFYAMPTAGESTGLRMVGDGRFVDRAKMIFNIEQRFTAVKAPVMKFITELEITPFIDIGTVAPEVSKLSFKKLKYGPGFATRIVIRPQIVGTADFAFGSEGLNTIVKVNYPF